MRYPFFFFVSFFIFFLDSLHAGVTSFNFVQGTSAYKKNDNYYIHDYYSGSDYILISDRYIWTVPMTCSSGMYNKYEYTTQGCINYPTCQSGEKFDVESETCVPDCLNIRTDEQCQDDLSDLNAFFDGETCSCKIDCDTSDPLGDCDGDGDPNATDEEPLNPDINTQNPSTGIDETCGFLDTLQLSDLQTLKRNVSTTNITKGHVENHTWGFIRVDEVYDECSAIVYTWFQCPHSQTYNSSSKKCELSPNEAEGDANCPSGYAKRDFYDFSRGLNYIPLWMENLGAENGHCYYKYLCKDNYTIVDLKEVSCSSEWAENDIEISKDENNETRMIFQDPYKDLDASNPLDKDFADQKIDGKETQQETDQAISTAVSSTATSMQGIENMLNGKDEEGEDEDVSEWTGNFEQGDTLMGSISDSLVGIKSSYSDMFSKINQGFDISVSPGSDPTFSTTVRGKEISISFCPFLSQVAPIFYYIFYVTFMILGIKLFYLGFKINRG